jgi:hypothetical protein
VSRAAYDGVALVRMGHVFDLLDSVSPCPRFRMAFFIVAWPRFRGCNGDSSMLAQIFHVRPLGDVSVLIFVPILFPLTRGHTCVA